MKVIKKDIEVGTLLSYRITSTDCIYYWQYGSKHTDTQLFLPFWVTGVVRAVELPSVVRPNVEFFLLEFWLNNEPRTLSILYSELVSSPSNFNLSTEVCRHYTLPSRHGIYYKMHNSDDYMMLYKQFQVFKNDGIVSAKGWTLDGHGSRPIVASSTSFDMLRDWMDSRPDCNLVDGLMYYYSWVNKEKKRNE